MSTHDWYTIVAMGEAAHTQYPDLPHGPWRGDDQARAALGRWQDRVGPSAGEAMNAMHVRIVGPFCSRAIARDADISDGSRYVCPHELSPEGSSARR